MLYNGVNPSFNRCGNIAYEVKIMEIGFMPGEQFHHLLKEIKPSMTWDGKQEPKAWQKAAREKLAELLGLCEIEKTATELKMEIEYDRYAEDLGGREIRFVFATEDNVTVPCHLVIPEGAKGPLPVLITLQGHSRGMHISLGRAKFPGDKNTISGGDRDFVKRAIKEGCCAIALEQRCFGEKSTLENSETDCAVPTMRAILLGRTVIGERVWDVMRCIDVIEKYFSDVADPEKVICLGNSGGGTATVYAAAIDERIKISVPSCALATYAESIGAVRHCNCNYVPYIAKYFDMGDLCAMTAPRSMVVVNGKDDVIFPIESAKECVEVGKRVYDAMGVSDELVHVIGAEGHRFYADDAWPHIHKAIEKL